MDLKFETSDSSDNDYPKTLLIHNDRHGIIWQVYHINDIIEQEIIMEGAKRNAFMYIRAINYDSEYEETFKDWRNSGSFKDQYRLRKNLNMLDES